jgi:uncharacterized membrane protein
MDYSTLRLEDGVSGYAVTGASINQGSNLMAMINAQVASGLTQYRPYQILANGSTSAYIGFSAEL